jgi:WD40 repeat protein
VRSWPREVKIAPFGYGTRTGEAIGKPLKGHTDLVTAIALGAVDGRQVLISGSRDHTIRLWDMRTSETIGKPLEGHTDYVTAVALGVVDGRQVLLSGSWDQTVRIWDAKNHLGWFALRVGTPVTCVDFRSDIGLVLGLTTGIFALEIRGIDKTM